jgi:hypothetical protein
MTFCMRQPPIRQNRDIPTPCANAFHRDREKKQVYATTQAVGERWNTSQNNQIEFNETLLVIQSPDWCYDQVALTFDNAVDLHFVELIQRWLKAWRAASSHNAGDATMRLLSYQETSILNTQCR